MTAWILLADHSLHYSYRLVAHGEQGLTALGCCLSTKVVEKEMQARN